MGAPPPWRPVERGRAMAMTSRAREAALSALKVAYAPVLFLGGVGAMLAAVGAGLPLATLYAVLAAAVALSFLAERLIPYEPAWNGVQGDTPRDWAHAVVNEALHAASLASIPLVAALVPWQGVWPDAWPLWAQLLLAVAVADLGITLAHRASHRWAWLWRFHAVHHSVTRMYGLNGLLKHPVHQSVEALAGTAPLLLLGIPVEVAALLAGAVGVQLLLQHSNADIRMGPLRHVLAWAPAHRFHHVADARRGDVNFGLFSTVWDRLMGTAAFDPARRFAPGDLGVDGRPDYPAAYLAQLAEPFRGRRRARMGTALAVHVDGELASHREARARGDRSGAWSALERAHVLSQPDAWLHTRVHLAMLGYGLALRDWAEVRGQVARAALAGPGSLLGRVPVGNVGRAAVPLAAAMPVPGDLAAKIQVARQAAAG